MAAGGNLALKAFKSSNSTEHYALRNLPQVVIGRRIPPGRLPPQAGYLRSGHPSEIHNSYTGLSSRIF